MKTRDPSPLRALVAAALLAAPGVQAQSADEMVERAMQVAQAGFDFGPGDAADALLGGRANERVVKGAPFCAEAQHEQVQWLPDGSGGAPNRIVRQTAWKICRDGEGRTRQEVERDGSTRVYLRDPVARENWVIDPARKTARRTGALSIEGLDRESMRLVADMARAAGAQLWLERVEVDDQTTVLIEDGQVAGEAEVPPVAAAG